MTKEQIIQALQTSAENLGFTDFEVTEDNVEKLGLEKPELINDFITQLNLIINETFYSNIGTFSELGKYLTIKSTKNGSGRKFTKFKLPSRNAYSGDEFNVYRTNTLTQIVKSKPSFQSSNETTYYSVVNNRFSPQIQIDKRELSKVFTLDGLMGYVNEIYNYLTDAFYDFITYKLMKEYLDNSDKLIGVQGDVFPYAIAQMSRLKNGLKADDVTPDNVDKGLRAVKEDLFVITSGEQYENYFTKYHTNPNLKVFDCTLIDDDYAQHSFICNRKAINIEIYGNSVEEFDVPNAPTRTNIFFNADVAINVDFSYPQICFNKVTKHYIVYDERYSRIKVVYDEADKFAIKINDDVFYIDATDDFIDLSSLYVGDTPTNNIVSVALIKDNKIGEFSDSVYIYSLVQMDLSNTKYILDNISYPSAFDVEVNFISNEEQFTEIINAFEETTYILNYGDTLVGNSNTGFIDEAYATVEFGDNAIVNNRNFRNWFFIAIGF